MGLPLMKFLNQSWETLIRLPSKASSRPPHLAAVMLTRDQRRAEGGSGLSGAETGRGGSVVVPVHVGQEAITNMALFTILRNRKDFFCSVKSLSHIIFAIFACLNICF